MNFESVAKIILGSGLFAFLITEIIRSVRRFKLKRRLTKEIAWEFFKNEFVVKSIIKAFQYLQENPLTYLVSYKFKTQIIESVINSGYFVNLNFKLSQQILEFQQRFNKIQYQLEIFFTLKDEEKIKKQNLDHLVKSESDSKLLLYDLRNRNVLRKLKRKHYFKWQREKIKDYEKKYNKKMKEKAKKEILKWAKKEAKK